MRGLRASGREFRRKKTSRKWLGFVGWRYSGVGRCDVTITPPFLSHPRPTRQIIGYYSISSVQSRYDPLPRIPRGFTLTLSLILVVETLKTSITIYFTTANVENVYKIFQFCKFLLFNKINLNV